MEITGFPTSADIYLEVDGKKVAVVQSYSSKASKTSQSVEAFGESEPVTTIPRTDQVCAGADAALAIPTTPSATVSASMTSATSPWLSASPTDGSSTAAAQWSTIAEEGELNAMVAEKVTVLAAKRIEVSA